MLQARRFPSLLLILVAALAVASCSSGGGPYRWREATITAPDGWVVHEEAATHFAITDAPLGDGEAPGPGQVGAFFTYEPQTLPDDWRELAAEQGWQLIEDERTEVGGAPATRLVIEQATGDVPTKEMVVLIPSRGFVILFQPTPTVDQGDAVATFDRFRDRFDQILATLTFGSPDREATSLA